MSRGLGDVYKRQDLLWRRIGRDVEVLGMQVQHGITHAATNEKRLVASLVQPVEYFQRAF